MPISPLYSPTYTMISTCSGAIVALLLCVLPGLLHPGEYLFRDGWCGTVGSAAGRRFLLLGCSAIWAGRGCGQWRCLLFSNTSILAAVTLIVALTHAVSVQLAVFEGRWTDGGLNGTH